MKNHDPTCKRRTGRFPEHIRLNPGARLEGTSGESQGAEAREHSRSQTLFLVQMRVLPQERSPDHQTVVPHHLRTRRMAGIVLLHQARFQRGSCTAILNSRAVFPHRTGLGSGWETGVSVPRPYRGGAPPPRSSCGGSPSPRVLKSRPTLSRT
jgi:hypothetical protein